MSGYAILLNLKERYAKVPFEHECYFANGKCAICDIEDHTITPSSDS